MNDHKEEYCQKVKLVVRKVSKEALYCLHIELLPLDRLVARASGASAASAWASAGHLREF